MKRHDVDELSLVFGTAFLVIVASWLMAKTVEIRWPSIGWVFAAGLVLIGLLGVISAIRPNRSR